MVGVGEHAPEFDGRTSDGGTLTSSTLRGHPLVLYFYPKANTSGCTAEARGFAEQYGAFQKAGVQVVGVSVDSVAAQRSFRERCDLPFPLIADDDKRIARAYDVLGFLGMAKRVTFLIGPDGTVEAVHQGVLPAPHVRAALDHWPIAGASPPREGGA